MTPDQPFAASGAPASKPPPIAVLLVDDHPIVRAGIRTLLQAEADVSVIAEAEDAESAVRLALELVPDVVLMDVSLPLGGGAEATRKILAVLPQVKVLALSAHEESSFARALLDAGASGYSLKRSACDELVRAIHVVATGGSYVDSALAGSMLTSPPASPEASSGAKLSAREVEVIQLVAQGFTAKEMASNLGLSPRTLETYKARAMTKLSLRSRADLIRFAMRAGWLREA